MTLKVSAHMYDKNNVFAKIIRGEIPSSKVCEDDKILAFHDVSPVAPTHVLVIPKGEYVDYSDFVKNAPKEDVLYYFTKVNDIAASLGLNEHGFRLCSNKGTNSGQSVFHFHMHILSGAKFGGVV
jgi:histidine triad (HIT) family protein